MIRKPKPLIYSIILLAAISLNSCKLNKKTTAKNTASVATPTPKPQPGAIKQFSEVITSKAKTDKGLFNIHTLEGRYYYEIPDSLLGREIAIKLP